MRATLLTALVLYIIQVCLILMIALRPLPSPDCRSQAPTTEAAIDNSISH